MAITGGIKFLDENLCLLDNGGACVASTGTAVQNNCIDKFPYTYWTSVDSSDSTTETLTLTFPSATVSRLLLLDHNWKQFTAQWWNGSAFTDFINTVGLDGSIGGTLQYAQLYNPSFSIIDFGSAFNPDYDTPWSVSFWANFSVDDGLELNNLAGDLGTTISIDAYANQQFILIANDSSHQIQVSFSATLIGTGWRHFVVRYNGSGVASGVNVELDGVSQSLTVDTDTLGGLASTSSNPFIVNGNGLIDELGIYGATTLTLGQSQAIYAAGRATPLTSLSTAGSLTHYYPMNGNADDAVGAIDGSPTDITFLSQSGAISETSFADTAAYYEFDAVTTTKLQLTVLKTQVANAEKFLATVMLTNELGTLVGYPQVDLIFNKNDRQMQMLSGRYKLVKQNPVFSANLSFDPYPSVRGSDIDLVMSLFDRETPFHVWLCGGRRGSRYFTYAQRGFRLKDVYRVQVLSNISPSYLDNLYQGGISSLVIPLVEHV